MKIALCTSDDEKYTEHFGKAQKFLIYEYEGQNVQFLDKRESIKIAGEKHQWKKSLQVLEDCEVIIAEQIGLRAKTAVKEMNKKVLEDEGTVHEVLQRFVQHQKFIEKPLFK